MASNRAQSTSARALGTRARFLELGGGGSERLAGRDVDAHGGGERRAGPIQQDLKSVARPEASEGQHRNDHKQGALHPPVEN